MKTCTGCGEAKPLTEFYRRKVGRDGYNARCKVCVAKTPEQIERDRERAREWRRENKARHQENVVAYRRRHPERLAAKNAVYQAIKRGRLSRGPCEVCGDPNTHAHHDDYTKRLDVRWLCVRHHAEADMERRRAA